MLDKNGKQLASGYHDLVAEVAELGKLPVVLFTAGGIANPRRRRHDDAAGRRRGVRLVALSY